MHQCDQQSPLFTYKKHSHANAWFKGTALLLLDNNMSVVAWTWFLNSPYHQIHTFKSSSRWAVNIGVKNNYLPPWSKGHYDLRLFRLDSHIFATYNCRSCKFSISQVHMEIGESSRGDVHSFQAWSVKRHVFYDDYLQGRNQALFNVNNRLYLQYRYGLTCDFKFVNYAHMRVMCASGIIEAPVYVVFQRTQLGGSCPSPLFFALSRCFLTVLQSKTFIVR